MQKQAALCVALLFAVFLSRPVQGADTPTAESIRAAAAAVRPAVVDIEVTKIRPSSPFERGMPWNPMSPRGRGQRGQPRMMPDEGDPGLTLPLPPNTPENLRRFFRLVPGEPAPEAGPAMARSVGLIVEVNGDRGLVAAPEQLVSNAEKVSVTLADGRKLDAKPLGIDEATGFGCLEIHAPDLKAAKPADPKAVQQGDWVLAVGGRESGGAVTIGIVSAVDRPGTGSLSGTRLLTTDAFIPASLAGAPLVNLKGEVVGEVLALYTRWAPADWNGRRFAEVLPVDTLTSTISQLAREGKVARGWLGIAIAPLPPEVREHLNVASGIQVARVMPDSPAAKAGMRDGDVILDYNGRKVTDPESFIGMVMATKPGERVPIVVLRNQEQVKLEVTVGDRAAGEGQPAAAPAPEAAGQKLDIGLTVQPLTPDLAKAMGHEGEKGLLVSNVEPDSPAAKARPAGIQNGELIKEIAMKPVETVEQARQAVAEARKAKEKTLLVLVMNKEGARYVVVDLSK